MQSPSVFFFRVFCRCLFVLRNAPLVATLSLTFMTRFVVMMSQSTRRFQLVLDVFFSPCSLLREYSETRYTCRDTAIVVKPTLKRFALMAQEEQAATGQQNGIAVKLPDFWTTNPEIWFRQAKAQFALRHVVSEETKYYYVLAALDQNTAQRLLDLLSNPPAANKYTAIKQRLLSTFALSETDRAAKLLNMPPLGDREPSTLMDEMLVLLGDRRIE